MVGRSLCWGGGWGSPLLSAISSQVQEKSFLSRVTQFTFQSGQVILIVLGVGQFHVPSSLTVDTLWGRGHPPGGHTCRKYCPESCGFHCSSNSECLWLLQKAQRGHLALSSRSHSLFSSVAAAFSSSGDCNIIIPRKAINRGRRGPVILSPAELVGT